MNATDKAICEAINKGLKDAYVNAMEVAGNVMIVEDGWVGRKYADGSFVRITELPKVDKRNIILD